MFLDESTVARLLRMNVGDRTDAALYYLLAPHLLGYWTFSKPEHDGREVGDLLFLFGDVCIIFEAKTRGKADEPSQGWIRAKLREAVSQVTQDHALLSQGRVPTLRNPWRGEVAWESLGIRYFQAVIVMMHQSVPYEPRDLEPSLLQSPIPTHVISLFDLSELVRLMSTPWDFVVYLEFRHRFGKRYELAVHREQSIYWGIISEWALLAKEQKPNHPDAKLADDVEFLRAYTRAVLRTGEVDDHARTRVAASYLLDVAAGGLMDKADKDDTGKRVGSPAHQELVHAVELIAELSRRRRAEYGVQWLTAARKAVASGTTELAKGFSPSRNRSYLFVARPGADFSPIELLSLARARMAIDGSRSVVALTASAATVVGTYESIRASLDGQQAPDGEVLDATALIIEKG